MKPNFKQREKVGVEGNLINQLMSNNSTLPEVGKGCTQMLYTDRICYEVVEVSEDYKRVKLEDLRAINVGKIGEQDWEFEPTGYFTNVVWRHGAWRKESKVIVFTDEFEKYCESKGITCIGQDLQKHNPELADRIYGDHYMPSNVVEGYTKEKITYNKMNLLFGEKDYYYDWTI